jgi:hypothetical protein
VNRLLLAASLLLAVHAPVAAQSVAGTWHAIMTTPGGSSEFKIVLRTQGDSVSGSVFRPSGEVPLTGMVQGDSLHFRYTIMYNEQPFPLAVHVKVTGDAMSGMVDFDGKAEEPFSAKRQPATKPK